MNWKFWLVLWAAVIAALGWMAGLGGVYFALAGFPALTVGILVFQWHTKHQAQYVSWAGWAILISLGLFAAAAILWWYWYIFLAITLIAVAALLLVVVFLWNRG